MDTIANWRDLALAGKWLDLISATSAYQHSEISVSAALWRIKALRALGRGSEANELLLTSATGTVEAKPEVAIELAEELIQSGYFKESKPIIKSLKSQYFEQSSFLSACLYRDQNQWELAEKAVEPLLASSTTWRLLGEITNGSIYLKRGWLDRASEIFARFEQDNSIPIQKLIARFELSIGKSADAETRLLKLAKRQPYDWEWPVLLGIVQATLGKELNACLKLVNIGLLRQPRNTDGWSFLARFHSVNCQNDASNNAMSQALSIKPWLDSVITPLLERLVAARDFETARNQTLKFISLADTPKRQAILLDIERLKGGKISEVVCQAERLEKRYPNDVDVLRSTAAAYQACHRNDLAIVKLERALELNPFDLAAQNNLAALYRDRNDLDDAVKLWQKLSDLGDNTAQMNLAQALVKRGDITQAALLVKALSQKIGNIPFIRRIQIELLIVLGNIQQAEKEAEALCQLEKNNSQNWILLAKVKAILNGIADAVKILTSAEYKTDSALIIRKSIFELLTILEQPEFVLKQARKWREEDNSEVEYYILEARALQALHSWDAVEQVLKLAYGLDPSEGGSHLLRFYVSRAYFRKARRFSDQWIRENPAEVRRWAQKAEVLFSDGRPTEALATLDMALEKDPNRLSIIRQKIGILMFLERYSEAADLAKNQWLRKYEVTTLSLWVDVLQRAGALDQAVDVVREALKIRPNDRALKLRLANQLSRAGDDSAALFELEYLFKENPDSDLIAKTYIRSLVKNNKIDIASSVIQRFSKSQNNRIDLQIAVASLALEQGLLEDATQQLDLIIERAPDQLDAWLLKAELEKKRHITSDEINVWKTITSRFPVERWINRALKNWIRLGLDSELQDSLNSWRIFEPNNPKPWWSAFRAAQLKKNYSACLNILDNIEKRTGQTAQSASSRSSVLSEQWLIKKAIDYARKAIELKPIDPQLVVNLINILVKAGQWDDFDQLFQKMELLSGDKKYNSYEQMFFNLNCHPEWSADQLYSIYEQWNKRVIKPSIAPAPSYTNEIVPNKKLKIGYISPDFRAHAVAKITEPMMQFHDKKYFELFAYSYLDPGQSDAYTDRFKNYFDHWRDITYWSLDELDKQIRQDKIDILVDLAGHTSNNRLAIFNRRPAPIQMSHLVGAGQTTGMSSVDYLIASPDIWPEELRSLAVEKLLHVQHKGVIFQPPADAPTPSELPYFKNKFITFGVFARPVRTSRKTIRIWSQILKAVPNSVIRFEHAPYLEQEIQEHFCNLFKENGIDRSRLGFFHTRPYWSSFSNIDIQLDPFPAGSGTTVTEGLYMNRLVVTLQSRPAMGLISFAQLKALGLDDICSSKSEKEYIEKAIFLANNQKILKEKSANLRATFLKSDIVNYRGYAEALGQAYRLAWIEYCNRERGQLP